MRSTIIQKQDRLSIHIQGDGETSLSGFSNTVGLALARNEEVREIILQNVNIGSGELSIFLQYLKDQGFAGDGATLKVTDCRTQHNDTAFVIGGRDQVLAARLDIEIEFKYFYDTPESNESEARYKADEKSDFRDMLVNAERTPFHGRQ